jgi:hypothetical protein
MINKFICLLCRHQWVYKTFKEDTAPGNCSPPGWAGCPGVGEDTIGYWLCKRCKWIGGGIRIRPKQPDSPWPNHTPWRPISTEEVQSCLSKVKDV